MSQSSLIFGGKNHHFPLRTPYCPNRSSSWTQPKPGTLAAARGGELVACPVGEKRLDLPKKHRKHMGK